jgi:hypothetical protein
VTLRKCALFSALLLVAAAASPAAAQISIGYPGPYGRGAYDLTSAVRLQVSPNTTEVYVDGFYAGKVDEFDGAFQRLRIEPGEHEIQLFLPGHRLHSEKVYLQPGNTFKVRYAMEPLAAGEPEPDKPVAAARPRPVRGAGPQPPGPQGPPDRPAPAGESGSVTIRVQPGDATILIDGQRWDAAAEGPVDARAQEDRLTVQLVPGAHTIEVRKSGYRGYLTEIRVEPGRSVPLNIALSPE